MTPYLKKTRQFFEAGVVWVAFILFRYILPFRASFSTAGWIGRTAGPCLPWNKRARLNLHKCFPNLTPIEINRILIDMWDNYARLPAEIAKADAFWNGKTLRNIEISGIEHLKNFQENGKPGIIFTAHTGNWQMITLAAKSIGFELTQMYRPPNNPWVDRIISKCQKRAVKNLITKKNKGPKELVTLLKRGEHALLLVDQKMGEGVPVPFLGRNAMTAKGVARMYLSQNCSLLPARCERLHDSHFKVTFYPPLEFVPEGNREQDIYNLLLEINTMIGEWIKERPSQWLWIHHRWIDS